MVESKKQPVQIQEAVIPRERAFSILSRVAQARSTVYGWLALSFYRPDDVLSHALTRGTMGKELSASTAWLGNDQQLLLPGIKALETCTTCRLGDLIAEHQRLFGKSVERISPCESTYSWRRSSDLLTDAEDLHRRLQQLYSQFGVSPVKEPADHIAVQMEFMAYLCGHEARKWQASAALAARQLRRQESDFLADHTGKWVPEFSWRMSKQIRPSFYTAAAGLADQWLKMEMGPNYRAVRAG
jgi:TorA maturation chaperone TorD